MQGFSAFRVNKNIWQIADCMGVYMTLLAGEKEALLIDAGYGMEDVHAFVRTLTDQPIRLMLTHGHHDHALGAMWFDDCFLFPEEFGTFDHYTNRDMRERVRNQALDKGLSVPDDYLTAEMPQKHALKSGCVDLGSLTADIRLCPGHTKGSCVVWVPECETLITGDNWNMCTWLFFEEAEGAKTHRKNLEKLLELPFRHVLCSHQGGLFERKKLEDFIRGIGDDRLMKAEKVDMGKPCDTRQVHPAPGQIFVFDFGKYTLEAKEE